jgi:hypothetical protein
MSKLAADARHLVLTEQKQITHSQPPQTQALKHKSAQIDRT